MTFKTVYKVLQVPGTGYPDFLEENQVLVEEQELKKILQQGEKKSLLYFLRTKQYEFSKFLGGGTDRQLQSSNIEGPLEEAPEVSGSTSYDDKTHDVLQRIVPQREMPLSFQRVELRKYCFSRELRHPITDRYLTDTEMDVPRFQELAGRALASFEHNADIKVKWENDPSRGYVGLLEGAMVLLNQEGITEYRPYQANLELITFGLEGSSQPIIQKLGLEKLKEVVTEPQLRERAFSFDSLQHGLAYHWSVEEHAQEIITDYDDEDDKEGQKTSQEAAFPDIISRFRSGIEENYDNIII